MKILKMKKILFCLLLLSEAFFAKNFIYAQNMEEISLHKGQSMFISNMHLQNKWSLISENNSVASVSDGIITANSVGETCCKSLETDADGNAFEKTYKVKVLPPVLVKYGFAEPNNPKLGETVTLHAITDVAVEQVKFLISTKNGNFEKISEERVSDGKNLIYKSPLKLDNVDKFKISFQIKIGGIWHNVENKFSVKVFEDSDKNVIERRASDECVDYIMAKEGFNPALRVDRCNQKVHDIGYGEVVRAGVSFYNNISKTEAKVQLLKKLNNGIFSRRINDFIIKNNLLISQNQFDALLSFTYNVGASWLNNSNLRNIILNKNNTNSIDLNNQKILIKSIGTVISDNGLRLRAQPNLQSKILKVLKFDEQVDVLSENVNGWFKVKTKNGQEGFCFAEFLTVKNEYTNSNIGFVNSSDGLRVRANKNKSSNILAVLKFNEQVEILSGKYYDWYKVKTKDGKEGFCFAEFLTIEPDKIKNFVSENEFSKEFLAYHNAGGKFVKGLLNRRVEELQIFFYGDYSCDGAKNKYNFLLPDCG